MNGETYQAAINAHNEAFHKFDAVRADYRSLKVDDAKFLAALREFKAATNVFDVAFAEFAKEAA